MKAMLFDPDALARDSLRPGASALGVELVPDGVRWQPAALVSRGEEPHGTLLDALAEAWGRVLEALAFRQERILNLAYVATTSQAEVIGREKKPIRLSRNIPASPGCRTSCRLDLTCELKALRGIRRASLPSEPQAS